MDNIVIIHNQCEWHEAQTSASNKARVLLPLSNLGHKGSFKYYITPKVVVDVQKYA